MLLFSYKAYFSGIVNLRVKGTPFKLKGPCNAIAF